MEKNYPIKIVQGNYFAIALPLSKIVWIDNIKVEQPLFPKSGDLITVSLVGSTRKYNMRNILVDSNVVHYECNESLELGTYAIELRFVLADGKRYRSYQRNRILIVATNEEAGITGENELDVDTYEISSAVLLYIKGEKGDKGDRGPKGDKGPVGPRGPRGFDGEPGQDGLDGKDGADGRDGRDGIDGKNGRDGADGRDGVSIVSVELTKTSTESSGVNEVTVTLSNGDSSIFEVRNGAQGQGGGAENVPEPSDSNPLMDGTASAGIASTYSRSDHVHPSDSSKLNQLLFYTELQLYNSAKISIVDGNDTLSELNLNSYNSGSIYANAALILLTNNYDNDGVNAIVIDDQDVNTAILISTKDGRKAYYNSNEIATVNQIVKPNWNATSGTAAEILNKPDLSFVNYNKSNNSLVLKNSDSYGSASVIIVCNTLSGVLITSTANAFTFNNNNVLTSANAYIDTSNNNNTVTIGSNSVTVPKITFKTWTTT